jgi:hypothetical protein
MKIRLGFAWSAVALLSWGGSSAFAANPYGSASMLPLPSVNAPVASVARANPKLGQPATNGEWSEASEEVAPPPSNVDGDYAAALQDTGWGDSNCSNGSCGMNGCGANGFGGCGSYWYGGVYGLIMRRDRENNLGLGYTTVGHQVLHSRDADMNWGGGYEVRLGHMCGDCSGASGWEVVYWSMPQNTGYAQATQDEYGTVIQSDLSMNNLNFGPDNVGNDWFDNADIASVRIQDTFYNLELNFLTLQGNPYAFGGGSRLSFGAGVGARWFRFDENFLYGVDVDAASDDPTESAYYNINMTNDLVGAQIAFQANFAATQRFSLFSEVKMGIYANYMQQSQLIARGDGAVATINNGPNSGQAWDFKSNKTDVAFLGELRLGGRFQISQNWSATAAYRAVAVTGVAFTTEQVPVNMGDIYGAQNIDSNGSMILHGVQVGAEYRF